MHSNKFCLPEIGRKMFNMSSLLQQMSMKYAAVEAVNVVADRSCQTMKMSLMKLCRLSGYSRPLVIF